MVWLLIVKNDVHEICSFRRDFAAKTDQYLLQQQAEILAIRKGTFRAHGQVAMDGSIDKQWPLTGGDLRERRS